MARKENESNRLFEDEKVIEIEIERLRSFKDHPFKVTDDKEMHLLKDSIKQYRKQKIDYFLWMKGLKIMSQWMRWRSFTYINRLHV